MTYVGATAKRPRFFWRNNLTTFPCWTLYEHAKKDERLLGQINKRGKRDWIGKLYDDADWRFQAETCDAIKALMEAAAEGELK